MSLSEKISMEMKAAMKSGDKLRLETLRSIRAALEKREIEKRGKGVNKLMSTMDAANLSKVPPEKTPSESTTELSQTTKKTSRLVDVTDQNEGKAYQIFGVPSQPPKTKPELPAITEEDELGVLQTAVKNRKESIELFEKGGRMDLVDREKKEMEIILTFLPRQMSVAEIEQTVSSIIAEVGATTVKEVGKVMALAMKALKGRAEGKVVQEVARKLLQSKAQTA